MRKTKLSAQEIKELDDTNKRATRNTGLAMMSVRDQGQASLKNYNGGDVKVAWHTPHFNNGVRRDIPDGMFVIDHKGETLAFDAEELQKVLRWA